METLIRSTEERLGVKEESQILNNIPDAREVQRMWEQLRKTEAEQNHFREHSRWAEKELTAANKWAPDAMDLVRAMKEVIDKPVEVLTRANL